MAKIFVRQRRHVSEGDRRPRFAVVAVQGVNLYLYKVHVRRAELEKIAAEVGADIVYLPRGEHAEGDQLHRGPRHRKQQQPE